MEESIGTEIHEFRSGNLSKASAYIGGPLLYALAIYHMIIHSTRHIVIYFDMFLIVAITFAIIQVFISKIIITGAQIEVKGFRRKRVHFAKITKYEYIKSQGIFIDAGKNYVTISGLKAYKDWEQIIRLSVLKIRQLSPEAEIKVPNEYR